MTNIENIKQIKPGAKIFFSGIGGSAMNAMAKLLKNEGFNISGSDPNIDPVIKERLNKEAIDVYTIQDGSYINSDITFIIATAAIPPQNPDILKASSLNIPVIKYAKMLGIIMNSFTGIAIAGTHGKTTTSAMTVQALSCDGQTPSFIIGGNVKSKDNGSRLGHELFIAEACEYDRSFLNLKPVVAVITNIEEDHLDIYSGIDDIIDTFKQFINQIDKNGALVYCIDSDAAAIAASLAECRTIPYGFSQKAELRAENIKSDHESNSFDVIYKGQKISEISLSMPGAHNILNALAVIGTGIALNKDVQAMSKALKEYQGVGRRFEKYGTAGEITVIDDYAHHPTEIKALLKGVKERYPKNRIVVLFQPHQISRTKLLFDDFAKSFTDADQVFISKIYAARDKTSDETITGIALSEKINSNGVKSQYCQNLEESEKTVSSFLKKGDIFLTAGAGDVFKVAQKIWNSLK